MTDAPGFEEKVGRACWFAERFLPQVGSFKHVGGFIDQFSRGEGIVQFRGHNTAEQFLDSLPAGIDYCESVTGKETEYLAGKRIRPPRARLPQLADDREIFFRVSALMPVRTERIDGFSDALIDDDAADGRSGEVR